MVHVSRSGNTFWPMKSFCYLLLNIFFFPHVLLSRKKALPWWYDSQTPLTRTLRGPYNGMPLSRCSGNGPTLPPVRLYLLRARSIQPNFPEISVQNSMDRFGPTGKVSKKRVHLLRWSSFFGRTGLNFGRMDRTLKFSCFTGNHFHLPRTGPEDVPYSFSYG